MDDVDDLNVSLYCVIKSFLEFLIFFLLSDLEWTRFLSIIENRNACATHGWINPRTMHKMYHAYTIHKYI